MCMLMHMYTKININCIYLENRLKTIDYRTNVTALEGNNKAATPRTHVFCCTVHAVPNIISGIYPSLFFHPVFHFLGH